MKRIAFLLAILILLGGAFNRVLAAADLAVTSIYTEPHGYYCKAYAKIENRGGPIPGDVFNRIKVEVDRGRPRIILLKDVDSEGLLCRPWGYVLWYLGRCSHLGFPIREVCVDPDRIVPDHDRRNNCKRIRRGVIPCHVKPPDIAVTKIYAEKLLDESCWVSAEIRNLGPGLLNPEEENWARITFQRDGGQVYEDTFKAHDPDHHRLIAPNSTLGLLIRLPSPIGHLRPGEQATFTVIADPDNKIWEGGQHGQPPINKENNIMTQLVKCDPLPDLAVTRIFTQPRPALGRCDIKAELKNLGGAINLTKFRKIEVDITVNGKSQTLKLSDIDRSSTLQGAGKSLVFTVPTSGAGNMLGILPGQSVTVSILADSSNVQQEITKLNNLKTQSLTCHLSTSGFHQQIPRRPSKNVAPKYRNISPRTPVYNKGIPKVNKETPK